MNRLTQLDWRVYRLPDEHEIMGITLFDRTYLVSFFFMYHNDVRFVRLLDAGMWEPGINMQYKVQIKCVNKWSNELTDLDYIAIEETDFLVNCGYLL